MVFIHHLAPRNFHPVLTNFIIELQAGVPVFFVLSGFLICNRYFADPPKGNLWVKKYFINRFARIYPMYFIITVANCIYFKATVAECFFNITFLLGYFNEFVFSLTPQNWSLTVEVTFYVFVPLIFFMLRKKINLVVQFLIFLGAGIVLTAFFSKLNFHGLFANYSFTIVLTFFGRCFEFLAGVYLARMVKLNKLSFLTKTNATYCGAAGLFATIAAISLVGGLSSYSGIFLHNIMLPLSICVLICGLISEQTFISKTLSLPIAQLLGKSSYTFFLIHVGIFHTLFYQYVISNLLLEFVYTSALSILLFKVLEEPLNLKSKKLLYSFVKQKPE